MKERCKSMEWSGVTTAVTNLMGVVTTVISTIADNAFLAVFLAVPIVAAGCKIFKKLIKTAK